MWTSDLSNARTAAPGPRSVCLLLIALAACGDSPTSPGTVLITAQPTDQSAVVGASATFTVAANNATGYQWQLASSGEAFVDIAGASSPTYTTPATVLADHGQRFRVVVSGGGNSLTSSAATLIVTAAPAFTEHPADQSLLLPAAATFRVTVTGSPHPDLQWQISTGGGAFTNIAGANNASYTTPPTSSSDNGSRYRAVATNASGSITSGAATLTVIAPVAPLFTQHPQDVSVTEGQNAQLTVVVTGVPTPTLQWQVSTDGGTVWGNIVGATGATLNIVGAAQSESGRQYRAVADNGVGPSVNSNAAVLSVVPPAPPLGITTSSPLPNGTTNAPYTVALAAAGGTSPYAWSVVSGSLPPSMTLSTDGVLSGTPSQAGFYNFTVQVRDSSVPSQSDERSFSVAIQAPCDLGYGALTVGGAPSTVGGRHCPGILTGPVGPGSNGVSWVMWTESNAPVVENVLLEFQASGGGLVGVAFELRDPIRSWTYLCTANPNANYPTCTGVAFDATGRTVRFTDTVVSSGGLPGFTLNGELRY